MSRTEATFMDQCLEGRVDPSMIDDFVDEWHDGDSKCSIHEYLGFSKEEYACWVEEPWVLRFILFGRKNSIPLKDALGWGSAENVAARATDLEESGTIEQWLKRTGRM